MNSVEAVFQAALAAREGGLPLDLAELCEGDEELQAEVESLLSHFEQAGADDDVETFRSGSDHKTVEFLNPDALHRSRRMMRAAAPMLDEWGASAVGQRIGGFTLIGELGAGGMAVVFIAQQDQPRRTVALKLIRRGSVTNAMILRFEREAHLLGRLNHPGIAQVFAAGIAPIVVDTGPAARAPYIAMEWVDGPNILHYVRQNSSDPVLALQLIAQVCDAIQHAHRHGVIHRDLKPANILVAAEAEGPAQAKVLDFGVALEAADATGHAATRITHHGYLIGTLAYMAPEQVHAAADVDGRCDVYALGTILYQLLSDRLPVDVADCSLPEAARRIVEQEPAKLGTINRALRGDIEIIVAKALEKDPARRYQAPADLARDIRHHLAGEPVEARDDSLIYVLRKRAARYRIFALIAAIVLVAVAALAIYARRQQHVQTDIARVATTARIEAEAANRRANTAAAHLAEELSAARLSQGRLLTGAGDLEGAERALWDESFEHPGSVRAHWALWEVYSKSHCISTITAHTGDCRALSISRDGSRFATGGQDAFVRIWSIPQGAKLGEFETRNKSIYAVAFSPDGSQLVASGEGGSVMIDISSGTLHKLEPSDDIALCADYSPKGLAVATGDEAGAVRLFDPRTRKLLCEIRGNSISNIATTQPQDPTQSGLRAVRFDRKAQHLAAMFESGEVKLWNLNFSESGVSVTPGAKIAGQDGIRGYTVDFNADGTLLGSGGAAGRRNFRIWRVSDGALQTSLETNNGTARSAAFSPDGRSVAVTGYWRTQIYDVASGRPIEPAMEGGAYSAGFSPDGRYLIVTGGSGACRIWDMEADPATLLPSTRFPIRDLAAKHIGDELRIASVQADGQFRLRVLQANAPPDAKWRDAVNVNLGNQPRSIDMTADGRLLVVGRSDGYIVTLRASDGQVVQSLRANPESVNAVRLSPDDKNLAVAGSDGNAQLWKRHNDGWTPGPILQCSGEVLGIAISADGGVVATTSRPTALAFWSIPDGRLLRRIETPTTSWIPAFSPEGHWLATGAWDRSLGLWDVRSLAGSQKDTSSLHPSINLMGHTQLIQGEAFDANGNLLASIATDGTVRLWDISGIQLEATAAPPFDHRRGLATLDAHAGESTAVAFLRDGEKQWLVAGYQDGSIRITDLHYFDPFIQGQADYQRQLRANARP